MKALAHLTILIGLVGLAILGTSLVSLSGCTSSGHLLFPTDARPLNAPASTQPTKQPDLVNDATNIAGGAITAAATGNAVPLVNSIGQTVGDLLRILFGAGAGAATTVAVKKARRNGKQERRTDRTPPPSDPPPTSPPPIVGALSPSPHTFPLTKAA